MIRIKQVSADAESLGSPSSLNPARWATRVLILLAGLLIAWQSWPVSQLAPGAGIDFSWKAALHMAAQRGLDYGTDIVYVYGPLGFLTVSELYAPKTTAAALLFTGLIHLALTFTILSILRKHLNLWVALLLSIPAARVLLWIEPSESLELLVFLWGARLLTDDMPQRRQTLLLAAGASISGVAFLLKLNTGIVVAVITYATVLGLRSKVASWAGLAGITLATFGAGWLGSGQPPDNLLAYARTSFEMIAGHSRFMGVEEANRGWEHVAGPVVVAALSMLLVQASRGIGARRGSMLLAMSGVFIFATAKHGFIRHDAGHAPPFFGIMLLATMACAVVWTRSQRKPVIVANIAVTILIAGVFLRIIPGYPENSGFEPAGRAVEQLRLMATGSNRGLFMDKARENLRNQYALDEKILGMVGDRTVHIEPWEASVAWAYPQLAWDPLPLFQGFTATAPRLDEMNGEVLRSSRGPELILRQTPRSVDYRYPFFEPPRTNVEILCRYAEVSNNGVWQLLEKTADRCGAPQLLGRVAAEAGSAVKVPQIAQDNALLLVKVKPSGESLLNLVRTQLYRSTATYIDLGANGVHRLVLDTANGGLLLKVPPAWGYTPPFVPAPPPEKISVLAGEIVEGVPTRERIKPAKLTPDPFETFEFEFYAVPFAPENPPPAGDPVIEQADGG